VLPFAFSPHRDDDREPAAREKAKGNTVPAIHPGSRWLLASLMGLACVTRLHDLGGYNLWHDEAWVALSIAQPSVRGMILDFDYPQTTPPAFLIVVRIVVALLGDSEAVLRLVPAVAGILSAALLWLLARRLSGSEIVAFLALALWISNPCLMRYHQELKQYATDALVTIALLHLTELFLAQEDPKRRARVGWLLTGTTIACLALSYTAALVIPALVVRRLWHVSSIRDSRARRRLLLGLGAYVGSTSVVFAALYLVFVRPQLQPWLFDFWRESLLSDHSFLGFLRFAARGTVGVFDFPFRAWDGIAFGNAAFLAAAFFAAGLVAVAARRQVGTFVYLSVPFLTTLAAASLGRYPYGGVRTDLFLAPLVVIGIAGGMAAPLRLLEKRRARVGWALAVALVLAIPVAELRAYGLGYPKLDEDVRSAVADLREGRRDSDFVAVHAPATSAFRYYAGESEGRWRSFGGWHARDLERGWRDLDRIVADEVAGGRLWLLFARERGGRRETIAHVGSRCDRLLRREYENALLALFSCPRLEGAGRRNQVTLSR
jgi:hypothetical protein